MKRLFTLFLGTVLAASQLQAAPKEDKGDRGRGHGQGNARAAAVSSGAPAQRASAVRASGQTRVATPAVTSTPRVSSNARVRSNNLVRSNNDLRASSQTAIRSADVQRNVTRDSSAARITATRSDRDWDGRRDRDRDGRRDRDWSDRRYRPSYDVYRNWDRGRVYSWNNHRYHWYGGSWVIYDSPTVVYSDDLPVVGASVAAEAQAELRRRGYYDGAVDGVIGPRTRNAIAEFQDDAGLAVTGHLNNSTLSALGIS